jgi:hypothetical protein
LFWILMAFSSFPLPGQSVVFSVTWFADEHKPWPVTQTLVFDYGMYLVIKLISNWGFFYTRDYAQLHCEKIK